MLAFRIQNKPAVLLALDIIGRITANTLAGRDKDGNPFLPYSKRPFAAPSGAFPDGVITKLDNLGELEWYEESSGKLWVIVLGGYVTLKALKRPGDGGTVNLSDTGRMLGALTVLDIDGESLTVGFTRGSEEGEKMSYNIELGRDPMGLPKKDWIELIKKHSTQLFEIIEV